MFGDNTWLLEILGLAEGHPYHSEVFLGDDERCQIAGIARFQIDNGRIRFEFFVDQTQDYLTLMQLTAEALQGESVAYIFVPSVSWRHAIYLMNAPSFPGDAGPLKGFLIGSDRSFATEFGDGDKPINSVTVELLDIPHDWGEWHLGYHYSVGRSPVEVTADQKHFLVPVDSQFGSRGLSGCTITAGGWKIDIHEVPFELRDNQRVTHRCFIAKSDGSMTGPSAWHFFDEELRPFLCFVFARNVQIAQITGDGWVKLGAVPPDAAKTLGENWCLLTSRYRPIDLCVLFQRFNDQSVAVKSDWRKVIDRYAASEEIIGTLGDVEIAEAVSFAAIDGLTRSIISEYSDKDQWLDNKLKLKDDLKRENGEDAGIVDAIELVLKRELGTENPNLRKMLGRLAGLRNSTVHTNLRSNPDMSKVYYRWTASQMLIEVLLLSKLGLKEIPNRTAYPRFAMMGLDIYRNARAETVLSKRCQGCGEWTGTLLHEDCGQSLCSACWQNHSLSGCPDASYPPAQ